MENLITSMHRKPFHFKQFKIYHDKCSMKVGTDGVLLGAWATIPKSKQVLDIGTGSGLIAIMIAQKSAEHVFIDAVEIENNAYHQALENVTNCPWPNRIHVHCDSIQEYANDCEKKYDHIISNPPFFMAGSKSDNKQRNTARHTDLLTHEDLLKAVHFLLSSIGKFSVILPIIEGDTFIEKAKAQKLHLSRLTKVKPKINKPYERLLLEFSNSEKAPIQNELIIQYEKRNDYTPEYIALTKQFYTIM